MTTGEVDADTTGGLVDVLFLLMRAIAVYGTDHPQAHKAAERVLEAVTNAEPPFTLQLVGEGLFRDRLLVPVEAARFLRLQEISRVLHELSAHELSFAKIPDAAALIRFGEVLAHVQGGSPDSLEGVEVPGLGWRAIEPARTGLDADQLDQELHALTQLSLAASDAERIETLGFEVWRFALGLSVVRHLERACHADVRAAARALELAPGRWTMPRRAVSAAFHVSAVLESLGVRRSTRRAVAHATLALAFYGYDQRAGRPLEEAARVAMGKVLAAPVAGSSGIPPHMLQVCTILHLLDPSNDSDPRQLEAVGLIRLCYLLERRRRPLELNYTPGKLELIASVALVQDIDGRWLRALLEVTGLVPEGSYVRLPDGRVGVCVDPGEEPLQPSVLGADEPLVPASVEPLSGLDLVARPR